MRFSAHFIATALMLLPVLAPAAPIFPSLTGRVVDAADILSTDAERRINAQLTAHEAKSGDQILVATIPDLQGYRIEDYGYQLGRAWRIGQQEKNNGALLIVAPKERKLRIEVGYGLEGVLTDAQSSDIVDRTIAPRFKTGDIDGGVEVGVARLIAVLEGNTAANTVPTAAQRPEVPGWFVFVSIVFALLFSLLIALGGGHPSGFGRIGRLGGSGGGGGFRGGGGSFGGGGASGSW
ncbi:MAG: TPM domain-containing protein [Pseudomonadota bacterium]